MYVYIYICERLIYLNLLYLRMKIKIKKYKIMYGSGNISKIRTSQHTEKRLKKYTNQSYKSKIELAKVEGELKRKQNKRKAEGKDGFQTKSMLQLAKKVSSSYSKVRQANVNMDKHINRSELSKKLLAVNNNKQILSLKTEAQAKFDKSKSQANRNIAAAELIRKQLRPTQGKNPSYAMLQLAKTISSANTKHINANSKSKIQQIKNKLNEVLKSNKYNKTTKHEHKRLAHYQIKQEKAIAEKDKANVELYRKLNRGRGPIYTKKMLQLAKKSGRAQTKQNVTNISIEKHAKRLNPNLSSPQTGLSSSVLPKYMPTLSQIQIPESIRQKTQVSIPSSLIQQQQKQYLLQQEQQEQQQQQKQLQLLQLERQQRQQLQQLQLERQQRQHGQQGQQGQQEPPQGLLQQQQRRSRGQSFSSELLYKMRASPVTGLPVNPFSRVGALSLLSSSLF